MNKAVSAARAFAFAAISVFLSAAPTMAFEPDNTECIAPAGAGGGWDFTCRQVGKALYDLKIVPSPVQVTNLSGGGGGVAYAEVVNKRNDDNNLIVAASSATSTRLAQGAFPGNTMDQVRWVGAVGSDYGVIAVSKELADQFAQRADGQDQSRSVLDRLCRRVGGRRLGSSEGADRGEGGRHR